MTSPFIIIALIFFIGWFFFFLAAGIAKIDVAEHMVALHYKHGKLLGVLEAGRHRFFGFGHQFEILDTRLQQFALQCQELNTSEGISIKATAAGFYRIVDPLKVVGVAEDHYSTIYSMVQFKLRDLINGVDAEELLSKSGELGPALLKLIKNGASDLGIEFTELVVRDLILPSEIKNALSEAWRAKKHSLAELEAARGKAAAARTLANAAKLYESNPSLLQVRYLEALEKAAEGMGHTFVVGMTNEQALSFKS